MGKLGNMRNGIYKKDITVMLTFQGAYMLELWVYGRLHKEQYMGYTLKEAKDKFIKQVRGYYEKYKIN